MKYLIFLLLPFMGTAQDSIPLTNHVYCLVGNELVKPSEDSVAYIQYHHLGKTDWGSTRVELFTSTRINL